MQKLDTRQVISDQRTISNGIAKRPFGEFNRFLWFIVAVVLLGFVEHSRAAERQVLQHAVPAAVTNLHLQTVGRLPGTTNLNFVIGLPLRNQPEFNQSLRDLYNPTSPSYHQYLTPQQIAERFGPADEDYQAVIAFVVSNGLALTGTYPDHTLLDVNGSVADIERTFHVTMRVYQHPTESRTFFAPDAEPSLDLAVPLAGIGGLNNFFVPHPGGSPRTASVPAASAQPGGGSGPGGAYWGSDFRAAYAPGVSLTGSGQVVGLLELDGYYTNDIISYETQAGVPNIPLTNVLVDGASGSPDGNGNWVGEVSLDIEMAIAMAPGLSKVMVYESPNCCYYWVDILKKMQQDNAAKQLSCSWLFDYDDPLADPIYQQMAMQGQSFFQCSGDDLAFYSGVGQWTDDPNVTLVGGTMLTTTVTNGPWASETTWNNGNGVNGTGGGISGSYLGNVAIPYWQQGLNMTNNHGSTTMRNVPDVSMLAYDAWVIWDNGSSDWWWGTSIAAPLWAGFTALVNQQAALNGQSPVGFINPTVYTIGQGPLYTYCFHDIATGNNTNSHSPASFFAVPGYDLCTGWGSPTGSNLISALLETSAFQAWQTQYFGSTTNPLAAATADADGTTQNNWFKFIAGLNPTNPASVFVLNIASATNQPSQNNLFFTPLALGRTYTPLFTTDLVNGVWLPLTTYTGPATNGGGTQVTITDTNPIPPKEFYRLNISLP
jgi:subtilase family serine protease